MKKSISDEKLCIDSEEEDREYNNNGEVEADGNDSDKFWNYSNVVNRQESKPSFFNPSWPQSYRQSVDFYSSVPSPSLGTPEILPSFSKPLLPSVEDEHQPSHRRSSRTLLPVSRKSSFSHAVLNGINAMCGIGILSTPYAVKQGG